MEHSFFDAPTADFCEMVRTMRLLGSAGALAEFDGEIYSGSAHRARP